MIVVDLGCHTWPHRPDHDSITKLVERFSPRVLYGFDPASEPADYTSNRGSRVVVNNAAAWVRAGLTGFMEDGMSSYTCATTTTENLVPCFDLNAWLRDLVRANPGEEIVVKLDVEGAEYALLERLVRDEWDSALRLLLVEWHAGQYEAAERKAWIRKRLRCPVEEW